MHDSSEPQMHRHSESPSIEAEGAANPQTVVVLLNWNGAQDSMDCIKSLLKMEKQDFIIVLCDNNSTDGSFERLIHWGETELSGLFATWTHTQPAPSHARVVLIQTGANLGFAGGCNVGLRYALLHTHAQYVWLLNNDTVVETTSLGLQVATMQQRPTVGILGSTLVYFDEPGHLQAAGGYDFNFWTGRVLSPARDLTLSNLPPENVIERRLKYISGASMFVRRSFIETVGLLNEQYFLYFEEIDWATRGKDRFSLGYCSTSQVLHKEGRSIGSHRQLFERSDFSEGYLSRNRVLFIKTYFPRRIAVCLAWIAFVGVVRIVRGRWRLALVLWKGAVRGVYAPVQPPPKLDHWPESMSRSST